MRRAQGWKRDKSVIRPDAFKTPTGDQDDASRAQRHALDFDGVCRRHRCGNRRRDFPLALTATCLNLRAGKKKRPQLGGRAEAVLSGLLCQGRLGT